MCIIAIYEKGATPDKKTLETMIQKNGDGIGVAWNDGERVHARKGLTTADEVLSIYNEARATAQTFIFHARIATSGGISAEKCHPFLIADNRRALDLTTYDGKRPLAFHNGVFDVTPADGLNDTQTLVRDMVYPLYKANPRAFVNGDFDANIRFLTRQNRFVILTPARVAFFGTWNESDGVKYSNYGWRDSLQFFSHHYGWDDDDECLWYGGKRYPLAKGNSIKWSRS